MKIVFLVRHGETLCNLKKIWQSPQDELSPRGFIQAETLAERLLGITFDAAISSSYKRAQQTAEVLAQRLGIVFRNSDNFIEIRNPSSTIGIEQGTEPGNKVFDYLQARDNSSDISEFRYEDEETVAELVSRARKALMELEACEGETVLVVTHGTFMRALVNVVLSQHQPDRSPAEIFLGGRFMLTTNTGITVLQYDNTKGHWLLLTFNDHAHFADN